MALDLEGDGPAVTNIDDASILADTDEENIGLRLLLAELREVVVLTVEPAETQLEVHVAGLEFFGEDLGNRALVDFLERNLTQLVEPGHHTQAVRAESGRGVEEINRRGDEPRDDALERPFGCEGDRDRGAHDRFGRRRAVLAGHEVHIDLVRRGNTLSADEANDLEAVA